MEDLSVLLGKYNERGMQKIASGDAKNCTHNNRY